MDNFQIQLVWQLFLALLLGGIIGIDRERKKRAAGLQTCSLVALGSCLFTIISCELFNYFLNKPGVSFDPSRIVLAVATGIGFIGAGVIIYRQDHVEGLTTAAALWTTASIGVAVGIKFYFLALVATFFTVLVLFVLGFLEQKIFPKTHR